MTCTAKHTKYQVPDKDFRCPKCSVGPDGLLPDGTRPLSGRRGSFVIEESVEGADPDCDKLHDGDEVECSNCQDRYVASGKAYAALMMKRADRVPCPCCKGEGTVTKKKAARRR